MAEVIKRWGPGEQYVIELPRRDTRIEDVNIWHADVCGWMLDNLEGIFTCDVDWGVVFPPRMPGPTHEIPNPCYYLRVTFDTLEDKFKFILRWG